MEEDNDTYLYVMDPDAFYKSLRAKNVPEDVIEHIHAYKFPEGYPTAQKPETRNYYIGKDGQKQFE